jgi:hypothetical protein
MLMASGDAREQVARVASMMMQIFEGSLIDFASKIASQFDVPQRDVLHLLKGEFRNVRATAKTRNWQPAGPVWLNPENEISAPEIRDAA